MPRPLALLDLPNLYRQRQQVICLDHARLLARGNPLGAAGLLAYLNPTRHIFSAVNDDASEPIYGGVIHAQGEPFARLLYLTPASQLGAEALPDLLGFLAAETVNWGAFHVTAEVPESSNAYRGLRKAGFSVYAWQRMWDLSGLAAPATPRVPWKRALSQNLPAMQSLHYQIIPSLMHPIEQPPRHASGLVCFNGDVRGFVKTFSGPSGVVLTPFIHPETNGVSELIISLLAHVTTAGKPVYLCVRSYQAWLEPALEDLGATTGERQAVMVKHLAHVLKEEQRVNAIQPAGAVQASRFAKIEKKR